jgi:RNA polymerase sigma factor (sigma-70 family)
MEVVVEWKGGEADFIEACCRNENWAQKKLYEDHFSMMYAVCARYANDQEDAMDILHDGFIKIFKNIQKYQSGTSLQAWMKRVMINTSIDYYRKEIRRRTSDVDEAIGLSNDDPDVVSLMSSEEILGALQELPTHYRSVFNLFVLEGFSHKDIAEILEITESTSRANLVKARGKLRSILIQKYGKHAELLKQYANNPSGESKF